MELSLENSCGQTTGIKSGRSYAALIEGRTFDINEHSSDVVTSQQFIVDWRIAYIATWGSHVRHQSIFCDVYYYGVWMVRGMASLIIHREEQGRLTRRISDYRELAHHAAILMFKYVAMKHERLVCARRLIELHRDLDTSVHQHGVFPAAIARRNGTAVLAQNLKHHAMDVQRMRHHLAFDGPNFGDTPLYAEVQLVHVKRLTIDGMPFVASSHHAAHTHIKRNVAPKRAQGDQIRHYTVKALR